MFGTQFESQLTLIVNNLNFHYFEVLFIVMHA